MSNISWSSCNDRIRILKNETVPRDLTSINNEIEDALSLSDSDYVYISGEDQSSKKILAKKFINPSKAELDKKVDLTSGAMLVHSEIKHSDGTFNVSSWNNSFDADRSKMSSIDVTNKGVTISNGLVSDRETGVIFGGCLKVLDEGAMYIHPEGKSKLPNVIATIGDLSTKQDVLTEEDKYEIADLKDISGKVDKIDGYGLSECDFTSAYKNKLDSLPESPSEDGTYVLKCIVVDGIASYLWVLE